MNHSLKKYPVVGGFLFAYGIYSIQCCFLNVSMDSLPKASELVIVLGWVFSPCAPLIAGALLLGFKTVSRRTTVYILLTGSVLLSIHLLTVGMDMADSMKRDPSAGVLVILVPLVIIPGSIAAITMFLTAQRLPSR